MFPQDLSEECLRNGMGSLIEHSLEAVKKSLAALTEAADRLVVANREWASVRQVTNPCMPTVPTFAVRETDVSRHKGGTSGAPIMPRYVCLSDSKC